MAEQTTADPTAEQAAAPALRYAGIGSRETPAAITREMVGLAQRLAAAGWVLRSGGAHGADSAFEVGSRRGDPGGAEGGRTEIWLPWEEYNDRTGPSCATLDPYRQRAAERIAASAHPHWNACSDGVRKLHARNAAILLGPDLDAPVDVVVCWTPGGRARGGTAMAMRLAEANGIPVLNLAATPAPEVETLLETYAARARETDGAGRQQVRADLEDGILADELARGAGKGLPAPATLAENVAAAADQPLTAAQRERLERFETGLARQQAAREGRSPNPDAEVQDIWADAYGGRRGVPIPKMEPAAEAKTVTGSAILAAAHGETPETEAAEAEAPEADNTARPVDYPLPGIQWWPAGDTPAGIELGSWLARHSDSVQRHASHLQNIFGEMAAMAETERMETGGGSLRSSFLEAAGGEAEPDEEEERGLNDYPEQAVATARAVLALVRAVHAAGGSDAGRAAVLAALPAVPETGAAQAIDPTLARRGAEHYTPDPEASRARGRAVAPGGGAPRVHPQAQVADDAQLGRHVRIDRGVRVGRGCVIGDGVLLHEACALGDRVRIGPGASVGGGSVVSTPGAVEETAIGARTVVVSASVAPGAQVGDDAVLGAHGPERGARRRAPDDWVEIAAGAAIGAGTHVRTGSQVGERARVGAGCVLERGAAVPDRGEVDAASVVPPAVAKPASGPETSAWREIDVEALRADAAAGTVERRSAAAPGDPGGKGANKKPLDPKPPRIHESAQIDPSAQIGPGATVGRHCRVRRGAKVGPDAVLGPMTMMGAGAEVGAGVVTGRQVRIAAQATVGGHAVLDRGVQVAKGADVGMGAVLGTRVHVDSGAVVGNYATAGDDSRIGRGGRIGAQACLGSLRPTARNPAGAGSAGRTAPVPAAGASLGTQAELGPQVQLGAGAAVRAGAKVLALGAEPTRVGNNSVVGRNATLARGCGAGTSIGERVHCHGRLGDGVMVCDGAAIGAGTLVRDGAFIGEKAHLGASNLIGARAIVETGGQTGDRVHVYARAKVGSEAEVGSGATLHRRAGVPARTKVPAGTSVAAARNETRERLAESRETPLRADGGTETGAERSGAASRAARASRRKQAQQRDAPAVSRP